MHWNSLVEERATTTARNRDSATGILDEATIFLTAGKRRKRTEMRRKRKKCTRERKEERIERGKRKLRMHCTRAGRSGKESDAANGRYSSISMSEFVVRGQNEVCQTRGCQTQFSEGGNVERGAGCRTNMYPRAWFRRIKDFP